MKIVCYCFGYFDDDIRRDVLEHQGRSTIEEKIAEARKTGSCQCQDKNPRRT